MKIFIHVLVAIFLYPVSCTVFAVGNVYLQNSTSFKFDIITEQYGYSSLSKESEWQQTISSMQPWQKKKKILWYNRNEGITSGESFYFDTTIKINGVHVCTLKQKLIGTWRFSDLYHSLEIENNSASWSDSDAIKESTFTFAEKQFLVKYRDEMNLLTLSDDVIYSIHEVTPYSINEVYDDENKLNILSYNIYTVLTRSTGDINDRLAQLPPVLQGYDALILSEAFHNSARATLNDRIKNDFPYHTQVVDSSTSLEDGGVYIASHWPIVVERQIVYDNCDAEDCLAAKGAIYAKIKKQETFYHIFGTHAQAWSSEDNIQTRKKQFAQLVQFINDQNIPTDEAIIIGGDLNVDKINNHAEYQAMLQILGATEPEKSAYGHSYTFDAVTNNLASGSSEYLDYVLYKNSHLEPVEASNSVLVIKSPANSLFEHWELSDHYPVQGYFDFTETHLLDTLPPEFINQPEIHYTDDESIAIVVTLDKPGIIYSALLTNNDAEPTVEALVSETLPAINQMTLIVEAGSVDKIMRYDNLQPEENYQIFLIATNTEGVAQKNVISLTARTAAISSTNLAPSAPVLLFPEDQASVTVPVRLEWSPSTDPDGNELSYEVSICEHPQFVGCIPNYVAGINYGFRRVNPLDPIIKSELLASLNVKFSSYLAVFILIVFLGVLFIYSKLSLYMLAAYVCLTTCSAKENTEQNTQPLPRIEQADISNNTLSDTETNVEIKTVASNSTSKNEAAQKIKSPLSKEVASNAVDDPKKNSSLTEKDNASNSVDTLAAKSLIEEIIQLSDFRINKQSPINIADAKSDFLIYFSENLRDIADTIVQRFIGEMNSLNVFTEEELVIYFSQNGADLSDIETFFVSEISSSTTSPYSDTEYAKVILLFVEWLYKGALKTLTYEVSTVKPATTYYWKVVVTDKKGARTESNVRRFITQ